MAKQKRKSSLEELQQSNTGLNQSPLMMHPFIKEERKKTFKEGQIGLRQQNTIPLNFLEDLQIGFDEKQNLYDQQERDSPQKFFMETNFSVIYKNPIVDKEMINFDGNNSGEFSLPSLSQRSGLNIEQNFDYEDVQSPIANDFNFDDFQMKVPPTKQSVIEIKKEKIQKKDSSKRKDANSTQGLQEMDDDMLKPNVKNSRIRRQSNVSANKTDQLMKTLQKFTKIKINTESASQNLNNNQKIDKTFKLEEHDDDISEILKVFEVNYNQQLSLDDRRARMFIINQLMAARDQGQVKDDSFFMIVDKNSLEKIEDLSGRCLKFRQCVWKLKTHTTSLAAYIISSKIFDSLSLLIIILNSVQLALDDPTTGETPPLQAVIDNIFMGFYTFEMCLKIIGLGFVLNKGAYLRDPWNALDFIIVMTGLLSLFMAGSKLNLSGMRSFRVLRPLKTITNIPELKKLVETLLNSVAQLRDSFIVLYFFYLIFSIAGLQLFLGIFKKQCIEIETGRPHPDGDLCGSRACPDGFVCGKVNSNPFYEQSNFDTIFYSFITIYECVSLEGWTVVMKYAQKTYTQQAWFFFCPLTFIVPYFLLQFTQAVISNAFDQQHKNHDPNDGGVKKKKKRALMDFENLDPLEREAFVKNQEEARLEVLKKWRMIMYIKQKMRLSVKKFKEKKKVQEAQKQLLVKQNSMKIGFMNYIQNMHSSEQQNENGRAYQTQQPLIEIEGVSSNKKQENNDDTKQGFTNIQSQEDEIIKIEQQHQEDQKQLKSKREFFQKNLAQMESGPVSLKRKSRKTQGDHSTSRRISQDQSKFVLQSNLNKGRNSQSLGKTGSSSHTKEKNIQTLKMKGIARKNKNKNNIVLDENFFDNFISQDVASIEQKFTEKQLREIVLNMNGGKFLEEIDEDNNLILPSSRQQENYINEDALAINESMPSSLRSGGRRDENINQKMMSDDLIRENSIVSNDEYENTLFEDKFQTELLSQYLGPNAGFNSRQADKDGFGSKLDSTLTDLKLNDVNNLVTNRRPSGEQKHHRMRRHTQFQKIPSSEFLIEKKGKPELKAIQETEHKDEDQKNQLITILSGSSKIVPFSLGKYPKNKMKPIVLKKKFMGVSTIVQRDLVSAEQSIFNNKALVEQDVGHGKKIYIRKDKLDFEKQMEDIFEQRVRLKKNIAIEQAKKDSVDYLSKIKVKPFQRKCNLSNKVLGVTEDQTEVLNHMQLDSSDLTKEIQKKYNRALISELYVTGTLSITIGKKKEQERKYNLRKLQIAAVAYEEHENQAMREMVKYHLNFVSFSRSNNGIIDAVFDNTSSQNQTSQVSSVSKQQVSKPNANNQSGLKSRKTMSGAQLKNLAKFAIKNVIDETVGAENQVQLRKERYLNKQAAKDKEFQKKLQIYRINKDAMRSTLFRQIVIKNKNSKNTPVVDEVKDSDEEDFEEEDEEDQVEDDFLDLHFDCQTEILRAKKKALQNKASSVQWSGEDVLYDFNPEEAQRTRAIVEYMRIWQKGLFGKIKLVRYIIKSFVMGAFIDNFMTLCVAFNTICLAMDRYGIDQKTQNFLQQANTIFTYIFISEMSLKIIGLGLIKYLKDKMNYMDGSIVLLSLVEIFLSSGGGALSAFRSIRIFRTFRVLRITRLLRAMKDMSVILNALVKSLNSLMYLYMLVFLSIFIFALLGMQIFGGNLTFDDNQDTYPGVPRQNYDTFMWSFQVCFQLLTQENWQIVLYDTLRTPSVNKGLTMIYHIAWMTVGNTILLNLLMGIMLDSMKEEEAEETSEQKQKQNHLIEMRKKEGDQLIEYFLLAQSTQNQNKTGLLSGKGKRRKKKQNENLLEESFEFDQELFQTKSNFSILKKKKKNFEGNYCELSFYIFSKRNPFRRVLYTVINNFAFEAVIQFLILLSTIKLIVDGYIKNMPSTSLLVVVSGNFDYFFTAAFALESLMKALAMGFMMDKGTYLRETWSQLDFFIVITSMIDVCFASVNIPFIKILRLLRTLRPLRVISHNSEMKTIIVALIHSVSGIVYVGVLLLLVWMMFAILGVNLMGGKMYSCSVDPYLNYTPEECLTAKGVWSSFYFNYDNVGIALISLFVVATMENWPDQRNRAMDISGQGTGPIRNNATYYAFFFIIFILIGTYIFLNLFIGVIFMKFGDAQKEEIESTHLSEDQIKWVDMVKMVVQAKPELETTNIPKNKFRKKMHNIVTGSFYNYKPDEQKKANKFEIIIMICIVLNMFQMCVTYEGSLPQVNRALDLVNYAFTAVFVFEATIKLIAFGHTYFQSSWNLFDFFVVCSSIIDITMGLLNAKTISFLRIGPQLARVLRVLRVSRLFRLIKKYQGLNALLETIQFSLPALMNVFALLLLVYFIFAILANFMFGDVLTGDTIDDYTNFQTFGTSMLTLIRASTGEDWNNIMKDCSHTEADGCIEGQTCGSAYAVMFFIAFETIQGFIMLNLFILVTIQQFDKYYLKTDNILKKFKQNLSLFKDMWTFYTIDDYCQKIEGQQVVKFFYELAQLQTNEQFEEVRIVNFFYNLNKKPVLDIFALAQQKKQEELKKEQNDKEQKEKKEKSKSNIKQQDTIQNKFSDTIKKDSQTGEEPLNQTGSQDKSDNTATSNGTDRTKKKVIKDHELADQITKVIVKMDLEADGDGYVYFNELLFKTMKMVFGDEHLKNTILIEAEYKALRKIKQIKEKILKKQRAEARIQAMTVNPFVLKMFKHVSFKLWKNVFLKNQEKRYKQKEDKGEVDISDSEEVVEEDLIYEQVYETEEEVECSDQGSYEDEDENDEEDGQDEYDDEYGSGSGSQDIDNNSKLLSEEEQHQNDLDYKKQHL